MALDHGLLNLPLAKRMGNIDAEIDRYKKRVAREEATAHKGAVAEHKALKAQAKQLLAQHGEAIVAGHGKTLGVAKVRGMLKSWAHFNPTRLISFVAKFQQEQANP